MYINKEIVNFDFLLTFGLLSSWGFTAMSAFVA